MKTLQFNSIVKLLLTFFFSVFLLSACEIEETEPEDPCENVTCPAGQICFNGGCRSNGGSNQPDPCDNVVCENGGVCVNGQCNCQAGYTGDRCETKLVPTRVAINKIVILRFPEKKPNGDFWDNTQTGLPDLWFRVWRGNTQIHQQSFGSQIVNAVPGSNPPYEYVRTIYLNNVFDEHEILMYDYDGDPSSNAPDFMGSAAFYPYRTTRTAFPETLTVDNGGSVAFRLELSYSFN